MLTLRELQRVRTLEAGWTNQPIPRATAVHSADRPPVADSSTPPTTTAEQQRHPGS